MTFRGFLYWLARLLGDIEAVLKGRVGRRIARRAAGKLTGGPRKVVQVEARLGTSDKCGGGARDMLASWMICTSITAPFRPLR